MFGRDRERDPEGRMTLRDHIAELRTRVFKSLIAVFVGSVVGYAIAGWVLGLIQTPYCELPARIRGENDCTLHFFGVTEAFSVRLSLALTVGVLLAAPVWLYQLWAFIAPGLRPQERKWGVVFVATSVVLFATGGFLAFFVTEHALEFLLGALGEDATSILGVQEYISFLTTLLLIFGVGFEFPLMFVLLNAAGILSYRNMVGWWRWVVLAIFVFAAVASPTGDPFSMIALALPIVALYGVALLIARVHDKRAAKKQAASPYAGLSPDEASPLPVEPVEPVER